MPIALRKIAAERDLTPIFHGTYGEFNEIYWIGDPAIYCTPSLPRFSIHSSQVYIEINRHPLQGNRRGRGLLMKNKLILTACLFTLALWPQTPQAEFIQTASSGVYQSADGKTKVILGNDDGAQGIFVVQLDTPIPPQEFNPATIPLANSAHVFIRFDPSAENSYSQAVIGKNTFKLVGNLTLALGQRGAVSVNIDNTNPYLTVTVRGTGKQEDSLLGFYGITPVVQGVGTVATILTANQLNPDTAKVIKPYVIEGEVVSINGHPVQAPSLGIFVKREHQCLKSSTAILTLPQLRGIQAAKGEKAQAQLLEEALKTNSKVPPIKGHLILRADPSSPVIMLNIAEKNVLDLRLIRNSFSAKKICVLSPIN